MNKIVLMTALAAIGIAAQSHAAARVPDYADAPRQGVGACTTIPTTAAALSRARVLYEAGSYNAALDEVRRTLEAAPTAIGTNVAEQAAWLEAMCLHRLGDSRARDRFEQFLDAYPASLMRQDVMMCIADIEFEHNYAKALELYRRVDASALTSERHDEYDYRTAYCYLKLGDYDSAQTLMMSLRDKPEYRDAATFYLAYIAYAQRQYDTALEFFGQANTAEAPGDMTPYYLAQIYFVREDYSRSLDEARRILGRGTAGTAEFTAEANRIAGESLYHLDRFDEAVPHIRAYVDATIEPQPTSLYILGVSEYNSGEYANAVQTLRRVCDSPSAMGQNAYLYIGQALLKQNDTDAAIMAFDRAARMTFDNSARENAYYNYAVALSRGGSVPFGSSVKTFEEYLELFPESTHSDIVRRYIIAGYVTDRNYDAAIASINRTSNPSAEVLAAKQQVLYALGLRDLGAGRRGDAIARLEQALELARYDNKVAHETLMALGEAYLLDNQYTNAAENLKAYLQEASGKNANTRLAYYDLGYAELGLKHYGLAANAFRNVIDSPGSMSKHIVADAYTRLGDAHYYQKHWEQARKAYAHAFDMAPRTGDYPLFQQAVIASYTSDQAERLRLLQLLRKDFPSSSLMPEALLETAEAYQLSGDDENAERTLNYLTSKYPATQQGRQALLYLANIRANAGQKDEAATTYARLIREYPTSAEARQAAEVLKRYAAEAGEMERYEQFIAGIDNAPRLEAAESDRLSFEAAEEQYLNGRGIAPMRRYLKNYPKGHNRHRALAYLMDEASERQATDEAYKYASAIVKEYPDAEAAEDALAIVAAYDYAQGRQGNARDAWVKLSQRASTPENANAARMGLMRIARDQGDANALREAAQSVLSSSTLGAQDKTEAAFSMGLAEHLADNDKDARQIWSKLAKDASDIYGAKAAVYLAQNYLDHQMNDEALATAEAFTASGTPHQYWLARGFIILSDAMRAKGKVFEADEYLRAVRSNYTGDEADIFDAIDSRLGGK